MPDQDPQRPNDPAGRNGPKDGSNEAVCAGCGRRFSRASYERILTDVRADGSLRVTLMCSCGHYTTLDSPAD